MNSILKVLEEWNKRCWYALFRFLFRVKPEALPLAPGRLKKVLVFRYDRVGDMVVTMPALRYLHEQRLEVHVLCSKANSAVLDDCTLVWKRSILETSPLLILKTIRQLRAEKYDAILCMVFHRSTNAGVLANLVGPSALKVGRLFEKRRELYARLFNIQIELHSPHGTMPELLVHFCAALQGKQFEQSDFDYRLDVAEERIQSARTLLKELNAENCILINISAGQEHRSITEAQCERMFKQIRDVFPDRCVVLLCVRRDKDRALRIQQQSSSKVLVLPELDHILDVVALVGQCGLVISPDTAIVHIADAMRVPLIAIYLDPSPYWFASCSKHENVVCADANDMDSMSDHDFRQALQRITSATERGR